MSWRRSEKSDTALGSSFDGHQRVTVKVQRVGKGFRVQVVPPDEVASTGVPHALVPGALRGVIQRLDLPPADDATTHQLVEAQLERLMPGTADHVRWGWRRIDEAGAVLVCSAARRPLERLASQAGATPQPDLVTTPTAALLELFLTMGKPEQGPLTVVAVEGGGGGGGVDVGGRVHLLREVGGPGVELQTLDAPGAGAGAGGDHVMDGDGLASLLRSATSADVATPTAGSVLPRSGLATGSRFTLLTEATPTPPEWIAACRSALALEHVPVSDCLRLNAAPSVAGAGAGAGGGVGAGATSAGLSLSLAEWTAAGAAAGLLRSGPAINLLPPDQQRHAPARSTRPGIKRWAAAAVLLLGAAGFFIWADLQAARDAGDAIRAAGLERQQVRELDQQLEVARFLETSGPGILAILDEISQLTTGFMIDEVRFERDGQFVLQATSNSSGEVSQLVRDLSKMQTLDSVRIRNQAATGRDEIEYTLVAVPATRFQLPAVPPPLSPPPPSPPSEPDSDESPTDSAEADADAEESVEPESPAASSGAEARRRAAIADALGGEL